MHFLDHLERNDTDDTFIKNILFFPWNVTLHGVVCKLISYYYTNGLLEEMNQM